MLKNLKNIEYYFDYHLVTFLNGDIKKMNEKEILDLLINNCIKKVVIEESINEKVKYVKLYDEKNQHKFVYVDFLFDDFEKAKFIFIFFMKIKMDKGEENKKYFVIMDEKYNLIEYDKYLKLQELIENEIEKYIQIYPDLILKYQKYLKD